VRKVLLAVWSEPQIGQRSQRAFQADLERAGLRVEKDYAITEWGETFAGATSHSASRCARLAIAAMGA
jgi:hypothetical protein